MPAESDPDDSFELFDLRVEVICPPGARILCGAKPGDYFELRGEMLHLPAGQGISIYSLAAVLPLLAAKQRPTDVNDWMTSDAEIACPDPNCPTRLRISRVGKRLFRHAETTGPTVTGIEATALAPGYTISRLIKGGWQLAGGHGPVARDAAIADMHAYFEAGVTTFDCADIYTGVESLIGEFRRALDPALRQRLRVHTKFVPDLAVLPRIDRAYVRRTIERSCERLGQKRLDLVQLHWWDYGQPLLTDTALWLRELQEEGRITLLGGTNFDAPRAAALHSAGVRLTTMQVQYSLLDSRPAGRLSAVCAETGMRLLCYGTVAGGFLSERWLGAGEPAVLENRSLVKYKLIIQDAGGWDWFQALLRTLSAIGARHGVGIGAVASRYVLDLPHVAAVIVGVRNRSHLAQHSAIFGLRLDGADRAALAAVLAQRRTLEGDVYALERDRLGRHGRIMKYDLSDA